MLVADILNPPIQYDWIWFIIGTILFLTIPIWYGVVYYLTRKKPVKTFNTLRTLPTGADLDKLKEKYLRLIEEWYQRYQRQEISLKTLHRSLSMNCRYFVYEAKHFPAPLLTLSDLRLGPYPLLTRLIAKYYPDEFDVIDHDSAANSVDAAKGFIQQWN
jgi:hypothetical protein